MEKVNRNNTILKWSVLFCVALICAVLAERFYVNLEMIKELFLGGFNVFSLKSFFLGIMSGVALRRDLLFFLFFTFLGLHFLYKPRELYQFLFKNRYYIALGIFLFLVVNQYHGSSVALFNDTIQEGYSTEYAEPVLGVARAIRSDEWVVSTPNRISASYGENAFGQYNYLMRGTATPNIAAGRMFFSYASLTNPLTFGTFFFGIEYGQSILWNGTFILTFLVTIEMLLILCKNNKLISVAGAILVTFSSYNLWWSQVNWLLSAQACIVLGYYFILSHSKKAKVLCGIGLAIAAANFATDLYPAWIVPVGYLFLGLTIWIIVDKISIIKSMDKYDWLIIIMSLLFAISIIVVYFYFDQEYLQSVTSTVYPGKRIGLGGVNEDVLKKLFAWTISPLSVLNRINNPSEYSSFVTLFPLPFLLTFWYAYKNKGLDKLVVFFLIYALVLGTYCFIGWPEFLAKITFMAYSTSERAIDVFSFVQLYLLLIVLARIDSINKMSISLAVPTSVIIGLIQGYFAFKYFIDQDIPVLYFVLVFFTTIVLTFLIISKFSVLGDKGFNTGIVIGCVCVFVIGISVNPLQKGFDVILEKPLAKKIQDIVKVDPDGKWLDVSGGIVTPQFLLASGASTINSTNIIPNIELWHALDTKRIYEDIYNRYAHVSVELVNEETTFELIGPDSIKLNLAYSDLDVANVSYLFVNSTNKDEKLENLYPIIYEDQCLIYKIK